MTKLDKCRADKVCQEARELSVKQDRAAYAVWYEASYTVGGHYYAGGDYGDYEGRPPLTLSEARARFSGCIIIAAYVKGKELP